MEYEMEDLLPAAAWLTNLYTSGESSSVPYEIGRRLMEAVVYCLEENTDGTPDAPVPGALHTDVRGACEHGCNILIQKVYKAKALYEEILQGFDDYGCRNYRDTILKGMPAFFLRYDARFWPQNHILTLDYPLLCGNPDLCGADLILKYLEGIYLEKQLLDCFNRETVTGILDRLLPEYEELYLDNICYPILLHAVGCVITDKPVESPELTPEDYKEIEAYFKEDSPRQIEEKAGGLISVIVTQILRGKKETYFSGAGSSYSVRIWEGIKNQSLENIIV